MPTLPHVPFHPVIFAATYVLAQYVATLVHPSATIRPLVIAVLGAAGLLGGGLLVTRNRHAAGVIATSALAILMAKEFVHTGEALLRERPVVFAALSAAMLGAGLLSARIVRARWPPEGFTRLTANLNVLTLILLGVVLAGGVGRGLPWSLATDIKAPSPRPDVALGAPDVYLLLLDAYPAADVARRVFNIDTGAFITALEAREFDVAAQSRSNYWFTALTFASMLSMAPVHEVPEFAAVTRGELPARPKWRQASDRNAAFELLREHGYEIISVASGWEDVALRSADTAIDGGQVNDFEASLIRSTFLVDVLDAFFPTFLPNQQRDRILTTFDEVQRIVSQPSDWPRFVLAHVPAPHPPIAVDSEGSTVGWESASQFYAITHKQMGVSADEYDTLFASQLEYVNRRTLETIDAIIDASDGGAVIIVMSDHGPGNHRDPLNAASIDIRARLGNLFAAYTPGHDGLYPELSTPVNALNRLFNAYLGTDLSLAPDTSYASTLLGTDDKYLHLIPIPDHELGGP